MANHKSSLKRIRQEETRRLHNRYYGKTMRNAVRKLRATTDKNEAAAMLPGVSKMLDKLAKTNVRRLHNRYYGKTMRNAVRKLRATTDKNEAAAMLPGVSKMLDKLAKTNVIHKNKANNLKSKLAIYINKLA